MLVPLAVFAHSSPSLTMEAKFGADGGYSVQVNIDPRLFLSKVPATLPPVEAQWYRELSAEQRAKAEGDATEYLSRSVELRFDGQAVAMPKIKFYPIDGGTSVPMGADTKEVHLLAEMNAKVPDGAGRFQVALGAEANASLILLNSLEGKAARNPSVVFPGETSRSFALRVAETMGAGGVVDAGGGGDREALLAGLRNVTERVPLAHLMLCVGLALVSRRFFFSVGLLGLYQMLHLAASPLSAGMSSMALRSGAWMADATLVLAGIALVGMSQGGKSRYAGWLVVPMALWQGFYFLAPNEHTVSMVLLKNAGLSLAHLALVLLVWALRGLWRGAVAAGARRD